MSNILSNLIDQKGWCVADGATGTNLFGCGLETGYPPELWSVERPDDILWLHGSFLKAGSDLILTNSFGGTSFRLKLHESQDRVGELNIAAAQLARKAVEIHFANSGKRAIVAGSMGPTGELFEPLGKLTHSAAVAGLPNRLKRWPRAVLTFYGLRPCRQMKRWPPRSKQQNPLACRFARP